MDERYRDQLQKLSRDLDAVEARLRSHRQELIQLERRARGLLLLRLVLLMAVLYAGAALVLSRGG